MFISSNNNQSAVLLIVVDFLNKDRRLFGPTHRTNVEHACCEGGL